MDRAGSWIMKNEWSGNQHPLHSKIIPKKRGWAGRTSAHPLFFGGVGDQGNCSANGGGEGQEGRCEARGMTR